MKVLIIGATGTIGRAVADALATRHEVLRVGHLSGGLRVDINDPPSIHALFAKTGRVDALVSTAGKAYVGPFATMTDAQMRLGILDKMLGQINLARLGLDAINGRGSITLSSGLASRAHRPGWAVLSGVNAGLEAFTRSAATEMPRGIRLNIVSPGAVLESIAGLPSPNPFLEVATPAAEVAQAYVRLVEGRENGAVVDAGRV